MSSLEVAGTEDAALRRPERSLVARLAGNVGWLLFERAFVLVTGFVVNVWFLRYLGPESFGSYTYAVSIASLFASVASAGTDSILVRDLTREPDKEGLILGTALRIRIIAATLAWVGAVAMVSSARPDPLYRALVAIIGANAFCTSCGVFEYWFQARIKARPLVLARSGVALASQLGRLLMILGGATLTSFAWLYASTGAAMTAAAYILYRRYTTARVPFTFDWNRARTLLRDSWPLGVATLAITIYVKIDQVMLGQMTSNQETGVYATAAHLSELWYFIPTAIATTVFPVILQTGASEAQKRLRVQTFYDAMAAVSLVIATVMTVFAHPLITTMYGIPFSRAADMLVIHVWSLPFVSLGTARARLLVAENLTRFALIAAVAGGISNVLLNLYLIPMYGGNGAAWATLVSYALAGYGSSMFTAAVRPQFFMQTRALLVFLRPSGLAGLARR